jgi:hypothetical protein
MFVPVGHHFETTSAYSVNDLAPFFGIGNLEFLLKENGRLLVGGLDNARHEDGIWRRGCRME